MLHDSLSEIQDTIICLQECFNPDALDRIANALEGMDLNRMAVGENGK